MGITDKNFSVDMAAGMSTTIKLDSKGCASVPIIVTNRSAAGIDGQAVLVSIPITNPPSGAVEKKLVTIDGTDTRNFAVGQEQVFKVNIKVSPGTAAGEYSFRADFLNRAHTDWGGDSSPVFKFHVDEPTPKKRIPLLAIIIIAAVVLLIGGVTTWLLVRKPSVKAGPSPTPSPTPVATPNPTPTPNPLAGNWVNDNANTLSLTRLIITQNGNSVSVHAYGKCSPTDCDWGTQGGSGPTNDSAVVVWNQGFAVRTMTLRATAAGHLSSTLESVISGSVRQDVDSFHRLQIMIKPFNAVIR